MLIVAKARDPPGSNLWGNHNKREGRIWQKAKKGPTTLAPTIKTMIIQIIIMLTSVN